MPGKAVEIDGFITIDGAERQCVLMEIDSLI
jgi:hypothetical protein